jgi:hypothetical protein
METLLILAIAFLLLKFVAWAWLSFAALVGGLAYLITVILGLVRGAISRNP